MKVARQINEIEIAGQSRMLEQKVILSLRVKSRHVTADSVPL
jgi:hypothetical protein